MLYLMIGFSKGLLWEVPYLGINGKLQRCERQIIAGKIRNGFIGNTFVYLTKISIICLQVLSLYSFLLHPLIFA